MHRSNRAIRFAVAIPLTVFLTLTVAVAEPQDSSAIAEEIITQGPSPIPSVEERNARKKEILRLFEDEIEDAKSKSRKLAFSDRLLQTAKGTRDDPVASFVLLNLSREMGEAAGDIDAAEKAIAAMEERFDFDELSVRADSIKNVAAIPNLTTSMRRKVQAYGIDDKDCSKNETWFKGSALIPGKVNRIVISVRRDGIDVEVNRRPVSRYRGGMKRLSNHPDWEEPSRTCIVFGAFESPVSIHSAVIKPIGDDGKRAAVPFPETRKSPSQWVRDKLPEASEIDKLPESVYLDQLPETSFSVAWGVLGKNGKQGVPSRDALVLGRQQYNHALGVNPGDNKSARVTYMLHGKFRRLETNIGLSENKWNKPGKTISAVVSFSVYGDGRLLAEFRNARTSGKLESITADLTGVHTLALVVHCAGKSGGDWAAWVDPKVYK